MSMSQELIQQGGGNLVTGTTGSICTETSLYKSTDGKIEFIEYIASSTAFPPFPGGTGTKKCTWTKLSLSADGDKGEFNAVKVAPGTI